MGLFLSAVISYAGINEAMECLNHILAGSLPNTKPEFQDLVEYYSKQLQKSTKPSPSSDWTRECGQGYLCLTEDKNGKLKSATVKYYDGQPDSTAILFSTKISSFGQESLESNCSQTNGDYRTDRYTPTRTKTIITGTSESFSVGNRNRSPTPCKDLNTSETNHYSPKPLETDECDADEADSKEKLTWRYRPKSPVPQALPEIHFQSFDGNKIEEPVYSEDYLRSLDGIKTRPLQRSDPSGRRRSFRKRHSSSSSSRESRASREEELKMFTSLEEAEFERMGRGNVGGFGSTPNLAARSHSRSRSRESSKERRNESWSMEASVDSAADDDYNTELKPRLKELPKLDSFEEEREETKQNNEVTEEDEEIDFWANSSD